MTEAIGFQEIPSFAKEEYSLKGMLGKHRITVLSEFETEEIFTYLQEINQPVVEESFFFTAALFNEMELEILYEMIATIDQTLDAMDPKDLSSEEFVFQNIKSLLPSIPFEKKIPQEQKEHFSSFSSMDFTKEIVEQRNLLSKMARSKEKESTAPFFAVSCAKKTEKQLPSASVEKQIAHSAVPSFFSPFQPIKDLPQRLDKDGFNEKNQKNDQEQNEEKEDPKKRERSKVKIKGIFATTSSSAASSASNEPLPPVKNVGDVFHCFLLLMERILGQAQAEAHELYQKIKNRTDQVEILTKLIGKLNVIDGKVDWSKDEEMKLLVQQARAMGVEIPENKYTWTKDEKRYLLENIQMRKDTMEKMTQLERTDMQRYMQEAAHCHQARSNILKLMKEIGDTIIHNFRPS